MSLTLIVARGGVGDGVERDAPASESVRYRYFELGVEPMLLDTASLRGVYSFFGSFVARDLCTCDLCPRSGSIHPVCVKGGLIGNEPAGVGGLVGGVIVLTNGGLCPAVFGLA